MLHVDIVCFGKLKEAFWRDAVAEYAKRLAAFCKFTVTELDEARLDSASSKGDIERALDSEADEAFRYIDPKSYIFALCVEGTQMSSEDLCEKIKDAALDGSGRITFVIGSSYGLSDRIKKTANCKLSFSKLTFPHQLMRVILAEQLYRAFTIQKGIGYHK